MFTNHHFPIHRYPALYFFCALLTGALIAKGFYFSLLFCFLNREKRLQILFITLCLFSAFLFHTFAEKKLTHSIDNASIYLIPKKITKRGNSSFLIAKATLIDQKDISPFSVTIPVKKKQKQVFDSHFLVHGKLKKTRYGFYLFPSFYKKVKATFCLCHIRSLLKDKARKIISMHTRDSHITAYFTALVTGENTNAFIKNSFFASGILHTLVISGFHFSWVIFLLSLPLSCIMAKKIAYLFLFLLSIFYFIFLGSSCSIFRSWIAISFFLFTKFFSKQTLPLNTLAIAGIIAIITDPFCIYTISFALSFFSTFVIICLFKTVATLVNYLVAKRDRKILTLFPLNHKIIYYFLRFFLSACILSTLIQVCLLPLLAAFFPFISIWSLFFNAFFPITMVITLLLLILTFLCHPFMDTSILWQINECFSAPFLHVVIYGRGAFHGLLKFPTFSPYVIEISILLITIMCLKIEDSSFEKMLTDQE